jgi:hypothetical protein
MSRRGIWFILKSSPPGFVKANELYSYTPVVVEPDGDLYSFVITEKPDWAGFNTTKVNMEGTPSSSDEGKHGPIVISVTDTVGASDSVSFIIDVLKGSASSLSATYILLLSP